jgi:hypothetical protein
MVYSPIEVEKQPEPILRLWVIDVVIKRSEDEAAVIKHYGVHAYDKAEAMTKVSGQLLLAHKAHLIGINCISEAVDLTGEDNA